MRSLFLFALAALTALVVVAAEAAAQTPVRNVRTGTVTCGTTATAISVAPGHRTVWLANLTTTAIYLGGADVGQSGPICLSSNSASCLTTNINPVVGPGEMFCRTASGTATLHYLVAQ